MFGMLDYRAHKLLWLLCLPLRLLVRVSFFLNVGLAIFIAQWTEYQIPLKLLVGLVAFEGVGMLILGLWGIVFWAVNSAFFWLIDVVPADGADADEAREVVLKGKIIRLVKKLVDDIGNWSRDDTRAFVSIINWRAKYFFNAKERFETRVRRLKQRYEETGVQPREWPQSEVKELTADLELNWFENLIVNQSFFNSILGFSLMTIGVLYLSK
jgi:hypothetical protein